MNTDSKNNCGPNNAEPMLVNGHPVVFHMVMDNKKLGLSLEEARVQDMPDEYAIVTNNKAIAGLVIYAKYNHVWQVNPGSNRFLIRVLLKNIGVSLPPIDPNEFG